VVAVDLAAAVGPAGPVVVLAVGVAAGLAGVLADLAEDRAVGPEAREAAQEALEDLAEALVVPAREVLAVQARLGVADPEVVAQVGLDPDHLRAAVAVAGREAAALLALLVGVVMLAARPAMPPTPASIM